jgi:hypothetical protein
MNKQSLKDALLPKWEKTSTLLWSRHRIMLLAIAVAAFVDSFYVPISRDVDPGRSAEGLLSLIIGFRAVAASTPTLPVIISAGCLATLIAALNHILLKPASWLSTVVALLLLFIVLFWGGAKPPRSE